MAEMKWACFFGGTGGSLIAFSNPNLGSRAGRHSKCSLQYAAAAAAASSYRNIKAEVKTVKHHAIRSYTAASASSVDTPCKATR